MKAKHPPAYAAILSKSAELQLPMRHETDTTVHDRAAIERNPSKCFAWVIGDRGTHMCWDGISAKIAEAANEAVAGIMVRGLWFVWDGECLQACKDADEARDQLAYWATRRARFAAAQVSPRVPA